MFWHVLPLAQLTLLLLAMYVDFGIGKKGGDTTNDTGMTIKVATKASNGEGKGKCGTPAKERVTSCRDGFYPIDVAETCNSFPSHPEKLQIDVNFNKTTKKLSFNVTWKIPRSGTDNLWGFQILLIPYITGAGSSCYQINRKTSKDMHFQSDYPILFNVDYEIAVLSLPRRDIKEEFTYATNKQFKKTPSKCELFHNNGLKFPQDFNCDKCELFPEPHGENVPFSCRSLNVSVEKNGCHNGSSRVTWDKPKLNIPYRYLVEWESEADGIYNWTNVNKTENSIVLHGLKKDVTYTVKVRMFLSSKGKVINSKSRKRTLSCKKEDIDKETPSLSQSKKQAYRVVVYFLAAMFFIFVVVVYLYFCCKKQRRHRPGGAFCFRKKISTIRQMRCEKDRALQMMESSIYDVKGPTAPTAMLLYCAGCERVKNFVLSLANLLNANGIRVFVDLLESNLIAQIGPAAYYEQREEVSEYVIIVCAQDTDTSSLPCHTAFNFLLNIIRNNIMTEAKRSKYIPIYIDSKKNVPSFLQSVALNFPNSFENIMQRLLGVRPYELTNSTFIAAVKHALQIDQITLNPLKTCISSILENKHQECVSGFCNKGLKSSANVDQISMDSVSLHSSGSSFNEFGASQLNMFEPDDDSSSFEFHPGMENGVLKVDSRVASLLKYDDESNNNQ